MIGQSHKATIADAALVSAVSVFSCTGGQMQQTQERVLGVVYSRHYGHALEGDVFDDATEQREVVTARPERRPAESKKRKRKWKRR